jgi:hypothetical protein
MNALPLTSRRHFKWAVEKLVVMAVLLGSIASLEVKLCAESEGKRPQVCDSPSTENSPLNSTTSAESKVGSLDKQERSHVKLDLIPVDERASRDRRGFPSVSAPAGTYGVEGHGVPGSVFYRSGEPMSAGELATRITNDSRYQPGMTVYLACCETGKGRRSFAQQLADTLGTEVIAPTEKLWPLQNGLFIVAPERRYHSYGVEMAQFADTDRLGTMKTFKPGRTSRVLVATSSDDTSIRQKSASTSASTSTNTGSSTSTRTRTASLDSNRETPKKPQLNSSMAKTAALLAELHGSYLNSKAR